MSGNESLASFTNRTFHLSRPPGFRRAFDAAERNGRFGRIQCQRGKESSSRGKRKRRVFLYKKIVVVKVGDKVLLASSLKVEGRRTLVGAKDRREGQIEELVGGQNPGPEAPPRSKKGQEKREQRKCQGRSNYQRAMEKGGCVRVIEGRGSEEESLRGRRSEEMIQSNTSSPRVSEVPLESQRG